MKGMLKVVVQIVHVVSFCGLMLAGVLGVIYEIVGHAKFEQMLSMIGISKGFERIWMFGAIMLFVLIITYYIKVRLLAN